MYTFNENDIQWNEEVVDISHPNNNITIYKTKNIVSLYGEVKFLDTLTDKWTTKTIAVGLPGAYLEQIISTYIITDVSTMDEIPYVPPFGILNNGTLRVYVRGNSLAGLCVRFHGAYIPQI